MTDTFITLFSVTHTHTHSFAFSHSLSLSQSHTCTLSIFIYFFLSISRSLSISLYLSLYLSIYFTHKRNRSIDLSFPSKTVIWINWPPFTPMTRRRYKNWHFFASRERERERETMESILHQKCFNGFGNSFILSGVAISYVLQSVRDLDKLNLVKLDHGTLVLRGLKPMFPIGPVASENDACFKSGQNKLC